MTISLPLLWLLGHVGAVGGTVLLLSQVFWRVRLALVLGAIGGALSCVFLAWILASIGKSFVGTYNWLAWLIAFLAGYLVAAPAGYLNWDRKRGQDKDEGS